MHLFPKIEQAKSGKSVGDQEKISLNPDVTSASIIPHLFFLDALINVPEGFRRIGAEIEAVNNKGESHLLYLNSIENGTLTADGNHQLAAQTANFSITIVSIRRAIDEELRLCTLDRDCSVRMFQ